MRILRWGLALVLVGVELLLAAGADAQVCANEALRSELHSGQLPDCRAYELVTPAYEEGELIDSVFAISEDGTHVVAGSFGVFAGTEDDIIGDSKLFGAVYEFSRSEKQGWTAYSLGPSASAYYSNGMYDASADLGSSLWELGKRSPPASAEESQPEGVTSFYIEQPQGKFTDIGPVTPNPGVTNLNRYEYLGGSDALSHILFSTSPGFHWPFDNTAAGASPLYEYVGTGNSQPMLVGVSGGKGNEELLSECGTRLGSGEEGSAYNAISKDGTRIFFTAVGKDDKSCGAAEPAVDELFAREELPAIPGELPATEARTVAISEPSKEDCKACLTSSGLRDAVFQGASEDGSRVLFMTAQELLPSAAGENLYMYDLNDPEGEKVTLISSGAKSGNAEVQGVARISEDGSHVYFIAKGVLTEDPNTQGEIAVSGKDNLYMFERDARYPEGHTMFIASLSPEDSQDWVQVDRRPVLSSRNNRFLVFASRADITHENTTSSIPQVYQYNTETQALVRASIGQEGYNNDGRTPLYGSEMSTGLGYGYAGNDSPTQAATVLAPEDGAVFFYSPDALTPQALNDNLDEAGSELESNIYEYHNGNVYLISDGRDISAANGFSAVALIGWSGTGGDLFLTTADPMITEDTNTQKDIYDARSEGGFQPPPGVSGCIEDGCHSVLSPTPSLSTPLAAAQAEVDLPPISIGKTKINKKVNKRHKKRIAKEKVRKNLRKPRKVQSHIRKISHT